MYFFRSENPRSSKAVEKGSGCGSIEEDWQYESLPRSQLLFQGMQHGKPYSRRHGKRGEYKIYFLCIFLKSKLSN